ncbi:hypothetical protein LXL04_017472 [Taraxacum kok-saghyz]
MLNEIETGRIPSVQEFYEFLLNKLGIVDAMSCRGELEFLEEHMMNHDDDIEPSATVLSGFVAMIRYCRFLLFGFEEDEVEIARGHIQKDSKKQGLISQKSLIQLLIQELRHR